MSCPFFRSKMFSPSDLVWYHSRTLGAHVLACCGALKYPCNPPPPRGETVTWRLPPPPPGGGETVARYGGRFQGAGRVVPLGSSGMSLYDLLSWLR